MVPSSLRHHFKHEVLVRLLHENSGCIRLYNSHSCIQLIVIVFFSLATGIPFLFLLKRFTFELADGFKCSSYFGHDDHIPLMIFPGRKARHV